MNQVHLCQLSTNMHAEREFMFRPANVNTPIPFCNIAKELDEMETEQTEFTVKPRKWHQPILWQASPLTTDKSLSRLMRKLWRAHECLIVISITVLSIPLAFAFFNTLIFGG